MGMSWVDDLDQRLKAAKRYLKSDFKVKDDKSRYIVN